MSEKDIIPAGQPQSQEPVQYEMPDETATAFIRQADDPYAPGDLPIGLLEFHSPTAALVNMPPTASAQYIIWLIGALMLSTLTVMVVFPLDKVVSTSGRLISTETPIVIQPLDASIVRSIKVREGDYVRKGEILAELDPTTTGADIDNMRAQTDQYQAEVDRLLAEADGRTYTATAQNLASAQQAEAFIRRQGEYNAKITNYDKMIASLQHDMKGYQASAAMYAAQSKVAADVHSMRMQLQKDQVGSKLSTLSAQNALMDIERLQIAAQQQAASTSNKLAAQTSEKESYIQNWKAEVYRDLNTAEHHLAESKAAYRKALLHSQLVIMRAPEDSIILSLARVSVGGVLSAGQRMMTLIPVGKGLEVEAVLSGKDVGFVKLGDKALVKFETFPFQQYGGAEAVVRTISADSFVQDEDAQQVGVSLDPKNQAFFRVHMRIDKYTLHGVPSFFHPQPGMPITADIKVGKRTIMQYMLNTIMPLMNQGMREP